MKHIYRRAFGGYELRIKDYLHIVIYYFSSKLETKHRLSQYYTVLCTPFAKV